MDPASQPLLNAARKLPLSTLPILGACFLKSARQRAALYAGGFIGAFTGYMTASILPELGASFDRTADEAAVSLVAYLLPFATLMLVSGRLGALWGTRTSMMVAYAVFAVAAAGCALAPTWEGFLAAYALCGAANAFTTPLIMAIVGATVQRKRLGRALGLYGAMQGLGQLSSPLVGGLLAQNSWRNAFWLVAVIALLLCLAGVPSTTRGQVAPRGARSAIVGRLAGFSGMFFILGGGVAGLAFLVAIHADASFESSSVERGLILMAGGIASLLVATTSGHIVDRFGSEVVTVFGFAMACAALAMIPFAGVPIALALLWACTMAAAQAAMVAMNKSVLSEQGGGTAISIVHSFRFFGFALAPAVVLPLYRIDASWGFWGPAIAALVTAMVFAATRLLPEGRAPMDRAAGPSA